MSTWRGTRTRSRPSRRGSRPGVPWSGPGQYLKSNPYNRYIPSTNQGRVYAAADAAPDTVYQTNYGWIFNTTTGELWAGGFDDEDSPLPKP